MSRAKKKALYLTLTMAQIITKTGELPNMSLRKMHFDTLRKPLNKIPWYMRAIGKRGAAKTKGRQAAA